MCTIALRGGENKLKIAQLIRKTYEPSFSLLDAIETYIYSKKEKNYALRKVSFLSRITFSFNYYSVYCRKGLIIWTHNILYT